MTKVMSVRQINGELLVGESESDKGKRSEPER